MGFFFDKDEIRKQCDDFFSMYNVTKEETREMCVRKRVHTHAVAENSRQIAGAWGLNEYDRDMAWVIGELHDFARFGQAVVTGTFRDSNQYDHAAMAVRLLFKHGMIEDIIPGYHDISEEDRLVMEKAVYYHSVLRLPDNLSKREKIFCDIIREADRVDIFRIVVESGWETIYGCSRETVFSSAISEEVFSAFEKHELVDYARRRTKADYYMGHIALCFGLKTKAAMELAATQGYIRSLLEAEFSDPDVQREFDKAAEQVMDYLLLQPEGC